MTAAINRQRAIFVGCARNCAAALPYVLENAARLSRLFAESAFVFVENDSRDPTKDILRRWCGATANARLLTFDGLAAAWPLRSPRVAFSRNRCLAVLRSDFPHYDYLFILDCDEVNAAPLDLDAVKRAIEFLTGDESCAGVFGNSEGLYYDMWALRHPSQCPNDIWEEVCDYALGHGVSDDEAFRQTFAKRLFRLAPDQASPWPVDSAFGGLGIYKVASVLNNKRDYIGHKAKLVQSPRLNGGEPQQLAWQICEHVPFHFGFRERGERLFVLPYLVNCRSGEPSFAPSAWHTFLFDPQRLPAQTFEATEIVTAAKTARNQPCPCGSGRKYKHCHGALGPNS